MHAKNNHTSTCVNDDISSLARVSNDMSNLARVSDDMSNIVHVSYDISEQLGCDMCHQSNFAACRLPTPKPLKIEAFQRYLRERSSHLEHKQHQRRFRSTETLLESSPEASRNFKNFDLKCKEHLEHNHLNYLPRSQRPLESSLKASRNLNKPQISEALRIQSSKALKNFHHKPSNTKNI